MSDYGKMQKCWVIVRCTHAVTVDGERVRCVATDRVNVYLGPAYHKHGKFKHYMEPVALAVNEGEPFMERESVEQPMKQAAVEFAEEIQNGYT